eukprot:1144163-Pelagomonas_calceolata.AAC.4
MRTGMLAPMQMLLNIKGLSEAKVTKMVEACRQMTPASGWRSASEVHAEVRGCCSRAAPKVARQRCRGSRAVDELLGGGLETKSITEIYGEYRCGKTQVLSDNFWKDAVLDDETLVINYCWEDIATP